MPEQVQKILSRILEWWKKFNTKQKALLISIAATIILALVILSVIVSRPTMVTLITCEDTAKAGEVKQLLDDNHVTYEISQDGLTFSVDEKDNSTAAILLGTNGIPTDGFGIDDVFDGGFSSTEADKNKRYKLYLEEHFADQLESLSNVESASVTIDPPTDDGTIIARNQETYAAVVLTLNGEMSDEQAAGLAKYIATQVGNKTTDNIVILDSSSNLLFSGGDSDSNMGTASTQFSLKSKVENQVRSKVKDILVGSGLYNHAEVSPEIDIDFDERREATHEYYAPEGQTNGMIDQIKQYESESEGGGAAAPGTDANDDTTYVIQDEDYTHSTVSDTTTDYQNNEKVTENKSNGGTINYDTSSIAAAVKTYTVYSEDVLRASGALDNMTFEEYIAANSTPTKETVDQEYYDMISNATGIPAENITIIATNEPVFQYSTGGRTWSDYLQIIAAVLIFLLLGYVVFRSTRKEKAPEMEPELSVESLLESTKENQDELENIGYAEKSETRVLIEKFVEENPEAAASLLRNWLNEEWE